MRTKIKMCFTLDVEVAYKLREHGNRSQLVNMAIRDYIRTLDSNRKMLNRLRVKLEEKENVEEKERERLAREGQERELKEEPERKKQSWIEEYKQSKRETDPKVEELKSNPIEQLKIKHWRENRTNPNHDPYECWWCKNYSDIGDSFKDR